MCHTDFSFGAPPRVKKERKKTDNPREGWEDGTPPPHRPRVSRRLKVKFFFRSARPAAAYQPTMAYRMRMFMSQKPSSVDLRVSDFKRVPGFNYVSAEDEHTYDSLCSDIREAWSINASNGLQIYAFPEGTKDESATVSYTHLTLPTKA